MQAARAARHLRAFDEAEGYLRRFERLNGDAMNGTLEAMLLGLNRGDLNADNANVNILDYVRQAPEGHAGAQEILEALSKLYMDSYRLQEARAALTLWVERDARNAKPLLWRGWVLEQLAAPRFVVADYVLAVDRVDDGTFDDPARERLRLAGDADDRAGSERLDCRQQVGRRCVVMRERPFVRREIRSRLHDDQRR